ncbi:MAG: DUF805 domain-containing protein [Pseudomonadota bacterium]|nr:DUF805 domain-containing protein [Pseudomonadota bacterium]
MAKHTDGFNNSLGACLKSYWTEYVGWGRATRSEYWWSVLFYVFLASAFFGENEALGTLWAIITLVPNFTVRVRRLHDTGHSAWNLLWNLLPIIGWIIILVYMCQPSTPKNQFGSPRIKITK